MRAGGEGDIVARTWKHTNDFWGPYGRDKLIQGLEMEMNTKTPKRMYSFASMKNWSILP